ncbi:MAG: hypothetical protein QOI05_3850 [Bradyrhizobium sp.]|jgi:hypothetical protein|nr:hypothetical protein [Bradyrhizobium sp.]
MVYIFKFVNGLHAPDAAQRETLREAVCCRAGAQLAKTVTGVPVLRSSA